MSNRYALIIGNSQYEDKNLGKLAAPDADVRALAKTLENSDVGGFDKVKTLINKSAAIAQREIASFFSNKKTKDLLLFYYSGHGILDDRGRLYLAFNDTERSLLRGTAISSAFIADEMDNSRSKRQVIILDSCHSGAFTRGTKGVVGQSVDTANAFKGSGYGRVILTASDATQYAWEGNKILGEAENSLFTHYLLEGIQTGKADQDKDGYISLAELYDYVYDRVTDSTSKQTPVKWSFKEQGDIYVAKNPGFKKKIASLPPDLITAIESPLSGVRRGAIIELRTLLEGSNPELAEQAHRRLEKLTEDDSRAVSLSAQDILDEFHGEKKVPEITTPPQVKEEPPPIKEKPVPKLVVEKKPKPIVKEPIKKKTTKEATTENQILKYVGIIGLIAALIWGGSWLFGGGGGGEESKVSQSQTQTAIAMVPPIDTKTPSPTASPTQTPTDTAIPTPTNTPTPSPTPFGGGGGKIAFSSDRDGDKDIYVMDADGSNQTNLTNNSENDLPPAWSPDGNKIAFQSYRNGNYEIYTMDADGSNLTNLTINSASDVGPAWSPDGAKIAFSSYRYGDYDIYVMDADGSNQINLTNNLGSASLHTWSPDGTKIAFRSWPDDNWEIYTMDADGSNLTNLTNNSTNDGPPAWSPDGAKIAFSSNRNGNFEIYTMNADGSNLTRLTEKAWDDLTPAWSPDGTKIAFASIHNGNFEIYTMNADGNNLTNLSNNSTNDYLSYWSPDGNKIAFTSDRDGNKEIYVMDADGSNVIRLTENEWDDSSPVWQPVVTGEVGDTGEATAEATSSSSLDIGYTMTSEVDGMVMVYVPEGEFEMGSEDKSINADPIHKVYLDAYWIDIYEVTNQQYAEFLNLIENQPEGGATWLDIKSENVHIHNSGGEWKADSGYSNHPMVEVSWYGASAYCEWAGRRLPTEAEWEKAARGTDGRTFPWGEGTNGNLANYDQIIGGTTPVGNYPAGGSPYGALDMAGNVWEWVVDWYDEDYYRNSPYENPQGPSSGKYKNKRGGSFGSNKLFIHSTVSLGNLPTLSEIGLGFRCALSP